LRARLPSLLISGPDGLAIGDEGNLFIADAHQGESFKVDGTSGLVTRVAGTGEQGFGGDRESARNASFRFANAMSVDKAGNRLIADYGNCRIRRLEHSTGIVRTLAVTGEVNQNGACAAGNLEPGPYPSDAVADSTGNAYFVEGAMDIVRSVDSQTLKLSPVGSGAKGYKGDGGPAVLAKLKDPSGLAIDRDGNLYVSEYVNSRIRRVDAKSKLITTIAGNGLPHRMEIMI